ncbi:MAG: DJ-1/PfpI family protein [Chloroflexi bacterium OHK40]
MKIAILAYDRMTALDAVGPYEVLCRIPNALVQFVAETPGSIRTDTHGFHSNLAIHAEARLEDLPDPDIVLIPGGSTGTMEVMRSERALNWLRAAHATSQWTTSVCTGAFILGAAGLLQGLQATTHWASRDFLAQVGATYVAERFVRQGKIITAAGVSAGIDMALFIAGQTGGDDLAQALQLAIEYDPQPPYDTGAWERATPALMQRALREIRCAGGMEHMAPT